VRAVRWVPAPPHGYASVAVRAAPRRLARGHSAWRKRRWSDARRCTDACHRTTFQWPWWPLDLWQGGRSGGGRARPRVRLVRNGSVGCSVRYGWGSGGRHRSPTRGGALPSRGHTRWCNGEGLASDIDPQHPAPPPIATTRSLPKCPPSRPPAAVVTAATAAQPPTPPPPPPPRVGRHRGGRDDGGERHTVGLPPAVGRAHGGLPRGDGTAWRRRGAVAAVGGGARASPRLRCRPPALGGRDGVATAAGGTREGSAPARPPAAGATPDGRPTARPRHPLSRPRHGAAAHAAAAAPRSRHASAGGAGGDRGRRTATRCPGDTTNVPRNKRENGQQRTRGSLWKDRMESQRANGRAWALRA